MSDQQLAALAKSSHKKKLSALAKTEKAIATLVENKSKITIRSVARTAGVSVSYIYKYPELAYKIQTLREQQKYDLIKAENSHSDGTEKVAKLEQVNLELRQENAELKLYIDRSKSKSNSLSKLQQDNIQLLQENQQLKRSLAYTEEKLQTAREFILGQRQPIGAEDLSLLEQQQDILPKVRKIKQM